MGSYKEKKPPANGTLKGGMNRLPGRFAAGASTPQRAGKRPAHLREL
ncbi:hypothetical protein [Anaeromassilibacillus sp. SJQ-1]